MDIEKLPPPIEGPCAWKALDWGSQESYSFRLRDEQLRELENESKRWLERGEGIESIEAG